MIFVLGVFPSIEMKHSVAPSCSVVTPLGVVGLPESCKDALADVTGTFWASFPPFHRAWKLSGRFSNK